MTADFAVRLHGYALMNNHYHLLLENVEAELSRALQWLNSGYGMWFNRRHRRTGHLFQGRFKAVVVEWERWGLELSRYVHLNPVRVRGLGLDKAARRRHRQGVGEEPGAAELRLRQTALREYLWSSYRAYLGKERKPEWLNCEAVLSLLGKEKASRRARYQQYVEEGLLEGSVTAPWASELYPQICRTPDGNVNRANGQCATGMHPVSRQ